MNLTQKFELVWPKLKSLNDFSKQNDGGETEKVLAMAILGIGSFIAGILPAFISERNRRRFPLATSLMLCFGAGVLLATAIIHILPEVRQQINSNWAEISICAGFFVIYFIDEFIHYFFGEAIQHSHTLESDNRQNATLSNTHHHNYGTLDNSESAPLLSTQNTVPSDITAYNHHHSHGHGNESDSCEENHEHVHCDDEIVADANARLCHTSHTEPCSQSMSGTLGLFAALSLHSAIEGVAIGVQNSSTKVLFLLGAVACHKYVMGFCLGLVFRSDPQTPFKSQIIGVTVFALGSVAGIGLGMLIVDIPNSWSITVLPVIQGLAGGTLLYVTVCEIIPREKAKWHMNSEKRLAGIIQFFMVALGFTVMCMLNFYFNDDA